MDVRKILEALSSSSNISQPTSKVLSSFPLDVSPVQVLNLDVQLPGVGIWVTLALFSAIPHLVLAS